MAYESYLEKGYIQENDRHIYTCETDLYEDTVILGVWDKDNKLAGSITLIFSGFDHFLPCQSLYAEEIKNNHDIGKYCEYSRLVMAKEYRNCKEVLRSLFNYASIYTNHVAGCDHILIQVNPRHKSYYEAYLGFSVIGEEKECPKVNGATSVLLKLPLALVEEQTRNCQAKKLCGERVPRVLYNDFIDIDLEAVVANDLSRQFQPMSYENKLWFELVPLEVI